MNEHEHSTNLFDRNLLRWNPSSESDRTNLKSNRSLLMLLNFKIVADVMSATFFNFLKEEIFTLTACPHGIIKTMTLDVLWVLFSWKDNHNDISKFTSNWWKIQKAIKTHFEYKWRSFIEFWQFPRFYSVFVQFNGIWVAKNERCWS